MGSSALREAIRSGASNLKERLFIQLEPDKASNTQYLRRGHVQFDGWNFTSRLVDLPTIIESHKTIDSKTFYKTADICQMLICKEGEGWNDDEDERSKQGRSEIFVAPWYRPSFEELPQEKVQEDVEDEICRSSRDREGGEAVAAGRQRRSEREVGGDH